MLPINLRSNLVCDVVIKGQETFTPIAVSSLKINQDMSFYPEVSPQAAYRARRPASWNTYATTEPFAGF